MSVRLVCASDLHGNSIALSYVGAMAKEHHADCILLAGDICANSITRHFIRLLPEISIYAKCPIILTPGNHDFWKLDTSFEISLGNGYAYTPNKYGGVQCIVENIADCPSKIITAYGRVLHIWGSPYTNRYGTWAWMRDIPDMVFDIPKHTDILLTHSPPFGYGDNTTKQERIGSEALTEAIKATPNLKLCIFGHNHDDAGWEGKIGNTVLRNCSMMSEDMKKIRYEGVGIIEI